MRNIKIKYLDWDTKQLGIPCGLIDGTEYRSLPQPDVLTTRVKALCEKKKYLKFITIKLPGAYLETVDSIAKMGALLIDAELTFSYVDKTVKENFRTCSDKFEFKFCKRCDSRAFLPLAKDMRLSRFFLDPHISHVKAAKLWRASIKNHCEGFADQLLVAYYNGRPCGMVALKFKNRKRIYLHIVGVLKDYRNKKVAKRMLDAVINRYAENYDIHVETQSTNSAAQMVYQAAGFKLGSLRYILHFWH